MAFHDSVRDPNGWGGELECSLFCKYINKEQGISFRLRIWGGDRDYDGGDEIVVLHEYGDQAGATVHTSQHKAPSPY
jgi:hypothetical protein